MSENGSPKRKFAREEKGETCGSEAALDPARQTECKQEAVTERRAIAIAHGFHCSHKDAAAAAGVVQSRAGTAGWREKTC